VEIRTVDHVAEFAAVARPALVADEPSNALPLGVLRQIEDGQHDDVSLALVEERGHPAGVVLRTAYWPWQVVAVGGADPARVGAAVGEWLAGSRPDGGEIAGPEPEADAAAAAWAAGTGATPEVRMRLRRMACTEVVWRPAPAGRPRLAGVEDVDELLALGEAFHTEALPHAPAFDRDAVRRWLEDRFRDGTHRRWLWCLDGREEPVSVLGIGSPTPSGERVGPVYTPPEHRGNGYAGALLAHATEDAFARGRRWVGLFTDADNPVSNRLYAKVGYEDLGPAVEWGVPPAGDERGDR
jgi:RimJ/RimL family protein N-acetyltransferase